MSLDALTPPPSPDSTPTPPPPTPPPPTRSWGRWLAFGLVVTVGTALTGGLMIGGVGALAAASTAVANGVGWSLVGVGAAGAVGSAYAGKKWSAGRNVKVHPTTNVLDETNKVGSRVLANKPQGTADGSVEGTPTEAQIKADINNPNLDLDDPSERTSSRESISAAAAATPSATPTPPSSGTEHTVKSKEMESMSAESDTRGVSNTASPPNPTVPDRPTNTSDESDALP